MCIAEIAIAAVTIGAVLSAVGATKEANAQNAAADYNSKMAQRDAQIADMQAKDIEERGAIEEKQHRLKVSQIKGEQRSLLADSGVVDEGTNLDLLIDTAQQGELDALTIRNNADREAWAKRVSASTFRSQSSMFASNKSSPVLAGATSFLSGVGNIAGTYAAFKA